jgi:hypothetical protein
MLYRFPLHLKFSEIPFTYGINIKPKDFLLVWISAVLGIMN